MCIRDSRRVIPVDNNRGVEQAWCHLEALVHDPIEILPEPFSVDPWSRRSENGKLGRRHKGPTRLLDRP